MKSIRIFIAVCLTAITPWAGAYELATHGAITYYAYQKSNLNSNTLLQNLGIDMLLTSPDTAKNPFGDTYYDIQGATVRGRAVQDFEGTIIEKRLEKTLSVNRLTLPGWLMRGAIREDDAKGEKNPQDDPYNSGLRRPLHHFFDPYNNKALDVFGLSSILFGQFVFR